MAWIEARLTSLGYGSEHLPQMTDAALAGILLWDACGDFNAGSLPFQDKYLLLIAHLEGIETVGLEPANAISATLVRPERAATARAVVEFNGAFLQPSESAAASRATY
jgi:hypothetical protein